MLVWSALLQRGEAARRRPQAQVAPELASMASSLRHRKAAVALGGTVRAMPECNAGVVTHREGATALWLGRPRSAVGPGNKMGVGSGRGRRLEIPLPRQLTATFSTGAARDGRGAAKSGAAQDKDREPGFLNGLVGYFLGLAAPKWPADTERKASSSRSGSITSISGVMKNPMSRSSESTFSYITTSSSQSASIGVSVYLDTPGFGNQSRVSVTGNLDIFTSLKVSQSTASLRARKDISDEAPVGWGQAYSSNLTWGVGPGRSNSDSACDPNLAKEQTKLACSDSAEAACDLWKAHEIVTPEAHLHPGESKLRTRAAVSAGAKAGCRTAAVMLLQLYDPIYTATGPLAATWLSSAARHRGRLGRGHPEMAAPEARRCGWAVVALGPDGFPLEAAYGLLPRAVQTAIEEGIGSLDWPDNCWADFFANLGAAEIELPNDAAGPCRAAAGAGHAKLHRLGCGQDLKLKRKVEPKLFPGQQLSLTRHEYQKAGVDRVQCIHCGRGAYADKTRSLLDCRPCQPTRLGQMRAAKSQSVPGAQLLASSEAVNLSMQLAGLVETQAGQKHPATAALGPASLGGEVQHLLAAAKGPALAKGPGSAGRPPRFAMQAWESSGALEDVLAQLASWWITDLEDQSHAYACWLQECVDYAHVDQALQLEGEAFKVRVHQFRGYLVAGRAFLCDRGDAFHVGVSRQRLYAAQGVGSIGVQATVKAMVGQAWQRKATVHESNLLAPSVKKCAAFVALQTCANFARIARGEADDAVAVPEFTGNHGCEDEGEGDVRVEAAVLRAQAGMASLGSDVRVAHHCSADLPQTVQSFAAADRAGSFVDELTEAKVMESGGHSRPQGRRRGADQRATRVKGNALARCEARLGPDGPGASAVAVKRANRLRSQGHWVGRPGPDARRATLARRLRRERAQARGGDTAAAAATAAVAELAPPQAPAAALEVRLVCLGKALLLLHHGADVALSCHMHRLGDALRAVATTLDVDMGFVHWGMEIKGDGDKARHELLVAADITVEACVAEPALELNGHGALAGNAADAWAAPRCGALSPAFVLDAAAVLLTELGFSTHEAETTAQADDRADGLVEDVLADDAKLNELEAHVSGDQQQKPEALGFVLDDVEEHVDKKWLGTLLFPTCSPLVRDTPVPYCDGVVEQPPFDVEGEEDAPPPLVESEIFFTYDDLEAMAATETRPLGSVRRLWAMASGRAEDSLC
ncbi:unnamed protein product [Prorocentrum cordatum]|uniref:Uncharacterized protein n=1 Tax=Prorocentrum cordatum TaxID=2364126 RepID=A0ABN9T0S9_9DINO|nr:unnamed protein product [Polarella glacialis]